LALLSCTAYEIIFKPLNAELNPTCHLLALLGAHHILHVSRIRVKLRFTPLYFMPKSEAIFNIGVLHGVVFDFHIHHHHQ
jgi:hypothetical protein